jgi:hypothetical protein
MLLRVGGVPHGTKENTNTFEGCAVRFTAIERASALVLQLLFKAGATAKAFLALSGASHFSLLVQRKVTKRKHTPSSRPPRYARRVRGTGGDSRKGHPAPAANAAHPCAAPFGCFPAGPAAAEGARKSRSHGNGNSNGNGNNLCRSTG